MFTICPFLYGAGGIKAQRLSLYFQTRDKTQPISFLLISWHLLCTVTLRGSVLLWSASNSDAVQLCLSFDLSRIASIMEITGRYTVVSFTCSGKRLDLQTSTHIFYVRHGFCAVSVSMMTHSAESEHWLCSVDLCIHPVASIGCEIVNKWQCASSIPAVFWWMRWWLRVMNCSLFSTLFSSHHFDWGWKRGPRPLHRWQGKHVPTSWRAFLTCCAAINRFFFKHPLPGHFTIF